MRRRGREIIQIGVCMPLDAVLERLQSLRLGFPDDAEPMVQVNGDDNFGWRLTVTYWREASAEELELEAKYISQVLASRSQPGPSHLNGRP